MKLSLFAITSAFALGSFASPTTIQKGAKTGFYRVAPNAKPRVLAVGDAVAWVVLYRWHTNGLTQPKLGLTSTQPSVESAKEVFAAPLAQIPMDVPEVDFDEERVLAAFGGEITGGLTLKATKLGAFHFVSTSPYTGAKTVSFGSLLAEDFALRKKYGKLTPAPYSQVKGLLVGKCPFDGKPLRVALLSQNRKVSYCVNDDVYWFRNGKWLGAFKAGKYTADFVPPPVMTMRAMGSAMSHDFFEPGVPHNFSYPVSFLATRAFTAAPVLPSNVKQRPNLTGFSRSDRKKLADLLKTYVTEAVLNEHETWHMANGAGGTLGVGSGLKFLDFHRAFIGKAEAWLAKNGGAKFVPLPIWNPATPIPVEFPDPDPVQNPRRTTTPNVPTPTWTTLKGGFTKAPLFGYKKIAQFKSADELGRALGTQPKAGQPSFHASAHVVIGGTMATFRSPADPMFFMWHGYVDNLYSIWEQTHN